MGAEGKMKIGREELEDLKEGLYEAFRESLVDLRAETAGLCEEEIEL